MIGCHVPHTRPLTQLNPLVPKCASDSKAFSYHHGSGVEIVDTTKSLLLPAAALAGPRANATSSHGFRASVRLFPVSSRKWNSPCCLACIDTQSFLRLKSEQDEGIPQSVLCRMLLKINVNFPNPSCIRKAEESGEHDLMQLLRVRGAGVQHRFGQRGGVPSSEANWAQVSRLVGQSRCSQGWRVSWIFPLGSDPGAGEGPGFA